MALKTKKAKPVDQTEEVTTPAPVQEEVAEKEPAMTADEKEAVTKAEEKKEADGASTERLRLATKVVSDKFNLGNDYKVNKFDDKGKVVNLTLENHEFTIAVTIKDSERHGMYVE